MSKFNILYISDTGDIIGGGELSLLGILSKLNKEKFNPLVVCPFRGDLTEEIERLGIEVRLVPMRSLKKLNFLFFISSVIDLVRILKNRQISLVHANGSRGASYGGAACKITKIPLIWHVRILESAGLYDRFLAWLSTFIIVNSNAVKSRFSWVRGKSKLEVVYNGIDLKRFNTSLGGEDIRREFGLSSETPLVGTVGRLDRYKAHEYFLRSAKTVKKYMPEPRFLIVGEGEQRSFLERMTGELGLEKNVIFTGYRKDMPEILASIDILVLSSVSEGFGRAAVEAMACGKPVVATRVGGLTEIVEDRITGRLVPPEDPFAMAKAIIALLRDKKIAGEMGRAGRKRAEKLFSIEINAGRIEGIYEKILAVKMP